MSAYRVFVRNWWRWERDRHGMRRLVPDPGARKTTIGSADTEEQARAMCDRYNKSHKPGVLSRKAEYTSK